MHMIRLIPILCICTLLLIGSGCKRTDIHVDSDDTSILNENQRADLQAPPDVVQRYQSAQRQSNGILRSYTHPFTKKSFSVNLPEEWQGSGPLWKLHGSDMTHIRVAYFAGVAAQDAWKEQQDLDIHEVLFQESTQDRYDMLVNHPTLKASIVKRFIVDQAPGSVGHYFIECRVGYDVDPSAWNACKTAIESLEVGGL